MSSKLFVGSLDWNVSSEDLHSIFAAFGTVVEAKVISDRDTGRSRGFGFVTMSTPEEARAAMQELDGTSQHGRTIRVNIAEEKSRDNRSRGGPRRGGNDRQARW